MADDQGKPIDGDDNGAMPNWVPVFPPSQRHPSIYPHSDFPGAGAPNWMTAFPTILHTVWKHTGDTRLIKRHWSALENYIGWLVLPSIHATEQINGEMYSRTLGWIRYDRKFKSFPDFAANPFRRTASGALSSTQFPGDWCPPPAKLGSFYDPELFGIADKKSGLGEAECGHTGVNPATGWNVTADLFTDKLLSSAFAYIKDKSYVTEMGMAIGEDMSAETEELAKAFNKAFLSRDGDHYGSGGQAAQSENALPLVLGLAPDEATQHRVVQFLLRDIAVKHHNHFSSGIVGLRAVLELLPKLGHADVALSMLLTTDYPSFGYEIKNTIEPATTVWELFDAPFEGSSMNSRTSSSQSLAQSSHALSQQSQ
eukprot:COSAG02_NODE_8491_length_2551_cov_2.682300_3_plen_369_part_00